MTFSMTRRSVLTGAAALAGSAALPLPAIAQNRPQLRIGANGIRNTLEPINAISNTGVRVSNALFDTLIKRDFFADGAPGNGTRLTAGLAESWERENDRSVLVTLRQGVKFHNGQEMTAEDVAYTFSEERLWGDEAIKSIPNGRNFSPDWDEPEIVSRYKVRLKTRTPSYQIEKFAASWIAWVVPAGYYSGLGAEKFGQAPIGTGPYKLLELRADDRVVLEPFDDYWGGRPASGELQFISVPEGTARVAGLLSGEYDIITTLTPDDMPLIDSRRDYDTRGTVVENFHMACFQQNLNTSLKDARLRKAIALCVNRPVLNEVLWQGLADVPKGFNFDFYGASYDPERAPFKHDPDLARALLEDVGYNGEEIEYLAFTHYYANHANALMMMLEMWNEVGLNIKPRLEGNGDNWGKVDIFNWSNGMQIPDAMATMVTEFGPGRTVQSRFGWDIPEEYAMLSGEVSALPDGPERFNKFNRMRDIFEDETPAMVLYRPYDVYAARSDIAWKPLSFEMMDLRPYNLSFA
ncbi:ABC transporter substrate-binding protein [Roseibium marinum]|uniref:Peptide/nickel transport system substrate-binding protein n=1 Tax=Roseibium marinum TaxID=281252 RepID=A0A2S3UK98_9HYPH|nr:ABC transporter substrate-binding protein [Roseibium marinum]POF28134.1 peptide/nickel transport system substrate-binding protein [Roseibium marinum]